MANSRPSSEEEKKESKTKPPAKKEKKAEKKLNDEEKLQDIQTRAKKIREHTPHLASPDTAYRGSRFDVYVKNLRQSMLQQVDKKSPGSKAAETAIHEACDTLRDKGKAVIGRPFTGEIKDAELKTYNNKLKQDYTQITEDKDVTDKFETAYQRLTDNSPHEKKAAIADFKTSNEQTRKDITSASNYAGVLEDVHKATERRDDMRSNIQAARLNDRFSEAAPQWRLLYPIDLEYDEKATADKTSDSPGAGEIDQKSNRENLEKTTLFEKAVEQYKKRANKEEMIWRLDGDVKPKKKIGPSDPGWNPNLLGEVQYVDDPNKKGEPNPFQIRITKSGRYEIEYTPEAHEKRFTLGSVLTGGGRSRQFNYVEPSNPLYEEGCVQRLKFISEFKGENNFHLVFDKPVTEPQDVKDRVLRIEANLNATEKYGRSMIQFDANTWKALQLYESYNGQAGRDRVARIKEKYKQVNSAVHQRLNKDKTAEEAVAKWRPEAEALQKELKVAQELKINLEAKEIKGDVSAKPQSYEILNTAVLERKAQVDTYTIDALQKVEQQLAQIKDIVARDPTHAPPQAVSEQLETLNALVQDIQSSLASKEAIEKETKAFKEEISKYAEGGDHKPPLQDTHVQDLEKQVADHIEKPREQLRQECEKNLVEISQTIKEISEKQQASARPAVGRRP